MIRLIRSEWLKLRTTSVPWLLLGLSILFTGLGILLSFLSGSSPGGRRAHGGAAWFTPHTVDQLRNLAGLPAQVQVEALLRARVLATWDPADLHARIQASQADRLMLQQCLLTGDYRGWDYQPLRDASRQYVRSGPLSSPSVVKGKLRYPPVAPTPLDTPRPPGLTTV